MNFSTDILCATSDLDAEAILNAAKNSSKYIAVLAIEDNWVGVYAS
jgi:hypothetical protein